ncbi:MAG: aminotransferase class V-fold PLP-dependent enzyme [Saprospiraceae bacterium]
MTSRRNFLQKLSTFTAATTLPFFNTVEGKTLVQTIQEKQYMSPDKIAKDEDFWHLIKQAYTVSPTVLNLNNGGVSPSPRTVQEAVEHYNRWSNELPSHYMWHILDRNGKEPIREKLANLAGCSKEEIAIHRNTTESLANVIFGLPLKAGDEIVLSKQDYPNMINAWKQRELRDGVVLKWVNLDPIMEDTALITQKYTEQFTAKTKLVHVTHAINWSGQILPVKAIADAAKQQNIEVLVDGAHTFAQLDFNIPDLNCDYFGTSLHKWLCAPFGTGMLYVKKDKIAKIYPLMAAPDSQSGDIRKFEHIGTRSIAIEQGIGQAIDFHQMIGSKRKEARLRYLKNYWAEKVLKIKGVSINTSMNPSFSGAIALLAVEGKTPREVASYLKSKHQIHSVAIVWENISGVRITPNVYTLTADLDRLVNAVKIFTKG